MQVVRGSITSGRPKHREYFKNYNVRKQFCEKIRFAWLCVCNITLFIITTKALQVSFILFIYSLQLYTLVYNKVLRTGEFSLKQYNE